MIYASGYPAELRTVPVFTGVNNLDMLQASPFDWVLVADPNTAHNAIWEAGDLWEHISFSAPDGVIQLHPDCVLLLQQPPSLSVQRREPSSWSMDADDGDVSNALPAVPLTALSDGNNLSVSFKNNVLSLVGVAGGGIGKYTQVPSSYVDLPSLDELVTCGLRDINGKYNDVTIAGGDSVQITADVEKERVGNVMRETLCVKLHVDTSEDAE